MELKKDIEVMMQIEKKEEKEIKKRFDETGDLDTIINDIKTLGTIKLKQEEKGKIIEEEKRIYLLIEEKDGRILFKYYDENSELIAVEDSTLELLVPAKEYENEGKLILKEIEDMDKEGISLSQIREKVKELESISNILGINIEDIESLDEIDLNQELEENKQEELTKQETSKLDIKETTNLSENIKGTTLANKLGINNITLPNGEKLTDGVKLARVNTNSLNQFTDKKSSMKDSFVVIRANGEAVPLGEDILEPDTRSGVNSNNSDLTINNDGTVNRETNTSSYKIVNGNGNEFLKVGYDEVSGREIKYSQWSNQKGEYVDTELKTNRNFVANNDVRQYLIAKGEGTREATDTLEKEEFHKEHGEEEQDITLVDHDDNNDSHQHIDENDYIPNTNMTWRQFANECGYRGKNSLENAQEKFQEECRKNSDLSNAEIVENVIEQENEEFIGDRTRKI